MRTDDTLTAPRRAAFRIGEEWHEGLAACVGTLIGVVAAFVASPPAPLSLDVWTVGAPLYGAVVGLCLATLRNGDGTGGAASRASRRTLAAVCAATWAMLALSALGT